MERPKTSGSCRAGPGTISVTRIVNSCVLIELGEHRILTDPWFRERWYFRFGEPLGMRISELPKLTAIIATHALSNHWDPASLAGYAYREETPIFVSTEAMAGQARKAGFRKVEVLAWGELRQVTQDLELEAVQAHRSFGVHVSSYVISSGGTRIFFGGEARDLEPIRAYRQSKPPVDILLGPVNAAHFLGQKLVMGPGDLLQAAGILGAGDVVPIHDAIDPIHRVLPRFLFRRDGCADDVSALAARTPEAAVRVHCLVTGARRDLRSESP